MSFTKTYFLCPTSEFINPPPAGPLNLGSIIRSTATPQFPLNGANVVPVANATPPIMETDWKKTVSAETGFGLGVYAHFLQVVTGGLGPEIDVAHSSRTTNVFAFDTVTTVSFEPTPQYVEEAVKAPGVQTYLREPKQRLTPIVSLYLITGMKLVKGANIEYSASGSTAVSGNIGIDIAPLGLTLGPKGRWSIKSDDGTQFSRESDFVFAFRVKRLRFGRKLKTEDYTKGAFLTVGTDQNEDESVLVEDVDGSTIENATLVRDFTEEDDVYCISPQRELFNHLY